MVDETTDTDQVVNKDQTSITDDDKKQLADQSGGKSDDKEDLRTPTEKALGKRLKEEADKRRDLEKKLQKIETDQDAVKQAELEEKGEFKTLLEQEREKRKASEESANEWETYKKARRDELIAKLTEDQKEIAESITTLSGLEKYVDSVLSDAKGTKISDAPPGKGSSGKFPGGFTTRKEFAQKDPDGYHKWREAQRSPLGLGQVTIPKGTWHGAGGTIISE